MLCNNNKLALTSSKPGKTRLINHFMINQSWYLVDLPGYGYAKVPGKVREQLSSMITNYINGSAQLVNLFVLLDSRHEIQKIDLEFLLKLGEAGVPFSIIFTKSDKLGTNALVKSIEQNKQILLRYWEELPPLFITSSLNKKGRDDILDYIECIIRNNIKS